MKKKQATTSSISNRKLVSRCRRSPYSNTYGNLINKTCRNKMTSVKGLNIYYIKNLNLQLILVSLLHPLFLHSSASTQNLSWQQNSAIWYWKLFFIEDSHNLLFPICMPNSQFLNCVWKDSFGLIPIFSQNQAKGP